MNDRFGAAHTLLPVLQEEATAFFTNGDDDTLQRAWAREHGLPGHSTLEDILRAQIESHRAEVFYNSDCMRYGNDFVRKLPGCVKFSIAWRAAPSGGADFSAYDLVVSNFPVLLQGYAARGMRTAYFFPAHDPVMDEYAANTERPVDVLFAGSYSRHHQRRARLLEAIAQLAARRNIVMHLDRSRLTRLAESPVGRLAPLGRYRRPRPIRTLAQPPVFGRELYRALSRSRITINGAIDMAGEERGNMRCWEALGCGALLVSDAGHYPEGMENGVTLMTFTDPADAVATIELALAGDERARAAAGHRMIRTLYSKERQWSAFCKLVGDRA